MLTDHSLLQAALEGLELKRSKIDEQIAQVKQALSGGTQPRRVKAIATETADLASKKKVSKKRVLSPEARERMAAAQKARWAKIRGEA